MIVRVPRPRAPGPKQRRGGATVRPGPAVISDGRGGGKEKLPDWPVELAWQCVSAGTPQRDLNLVFWGQGPIPCTTQHMLWIEVLATSHGDIGPCARRQIDDTIPRRNRIPSFPHHDPQT